PRGGGEPGPQRRALAAVAFVAQHAVDPPRELRRDDLPGRVGRRVVDQDDLLVGRLGGAHGVDQRLDGPLLVEAGDDDRNAHAYSSVTQPSEAVRTLRMYFASVPRCARSGGAVHAARRRASSASGISSTIVRFFASIVIRSPSRTSAIGPPSCASGV